MLKRVFSAIFAAAVCLTAVGCASPERAESGASSQTLQQSQGEVTLTIEDTVYKDGAITAVWSNKSSSGIMLGKAFKIEKQNDGNWVEEEHVSGNLGFEAIGLGLKKNSKDKLEYPVSEYYKISGPGKYRLLADYCFTDEKTGNVKNKDITVWAEFTVE